MEKKLLSQHKVSKASKKPEGGGLIGKLETNKKIAWLIGFQKDTIIVKWHPHGESNPGLQDENLAS